MSNKVNKETNQRIRRTVWFLAGLIVVIVAMFYYSVKYGGPVT